MIDGRKRENAYNAPGSLRYHPALFHQQWGEKGIPSTPMNINIPAYVFQSLRDCQRYMVRNSSCSAELCWSSRRRLSTRARSSGDRNLASSGKSTTIQKETTPIRTVAIPSRIYDRPWARLAWERESGFSLSF